jgi:hypothetical protein
MNSKLLITSAAITLGLAGIACLLLPKEILNLYNPATEDTQGLLVQLLGASLLALAALDWVSRNSLLGGIYGRPVVVTNHSHFVIGSLLMLRAVISQPNNLAIWLTLAAYVLFAIGFAIILFGPPPSKVPA